MDSPNSGPRQRSALVASVSILTCALLVCGGILVLKGQGWFQEPPSAADAVEEAVRLKAEGMVAYREWARGKQAGQRDVEGKRVEAIEKLEAFMDALEEILEPYRDPATGYVAKEYEGYEAELTEVAPFLYDLHKG